MFSFRKSHYQTSKQKCETNNELPHERFYAFYQIIKWLWFRSSHATGVLENFISNCERLFSHLYRESSNNSWRFLHFRIVGLFFPHFFFLLLLLFSEKGLVTMREQKLDGIDVNGYYLGWRNWDCLIVRRIISPQTWKKLKQVAEKDKKWFFCNKDMKMAFNCYKETSEKSSKRVF